MAKHQTRVVCDCDDSPFCLSGVYVPLLWDQVRELRAALENLTHAAPGLNADGTLYWDEQTPEAYDAALGAAVDVLSPELKVDEELNARDYYHATAASLLIRQRLDG